MKNFKLIQKLSLLTFTFLALTTTSCSKDGADGVPGKDGTNGSDASIANTGFDVSTYASQVIPAGAATKIIFENEYTDHLNTFNTSTYEWKTPTSGFYHIDLSVGFFTNLPTNSNVILYLYKNGSIFKRNSQYVSGQASINISTNTNFTANDFITAYLIQNSGATATLSNGPNTCSFSGYKVY